MRYAERLAGEAAEQAAKADEWLLPSEPGGLEAEGMERTWQLQQARRLHRAPAAALASVACVPLDGVWRAAAARKPQAAGCSSRKSGDVHRARSAQRGGPLKWGSRRPCSTRAQAALVCKGKEAQTCYTVGEGQAVTGSTGGAGGACARSGGGRGAQGV